MNPKILIGGVVVIVVLIGLIPLLSSGGSAAPQGAPAQQTTAPAAGPDGEGSAPAAEPAAGGGAPMPDLTNTSWKYKSYTVNLLPGGKATAQVGPMNVDGEWSVAGNTVTAKAMGQEIKATWNGTTLVGSDGTALQQVN